MFNIFLIHTFLACFYLQRPLRWSAYIFLASFYFWALNRFLWIFLGGDGGGCLVGLVMVLGFEGFVCLGV